MSTPGTLTITEAAARIGVNTKTIRRRIADGSLVGYRFGPRLIRVDPAEVDALLQPIPTAQTQPEVAATPIGHKVAITLAWRACQEYDAAWHSGDVTDDEMFKNLVELQCAIDDAIDRVSDVHA